MAGKRGSRHGFAALRHTNPAKQREIARQGGQAAHRCGKAHEWTVEEAREAGRKGGQQGRRIRKSVEEPVA